MEGLGSDHRGVAHNSSTDTGSNHSSDDYPNSESHQITAAGSDDEFGWNDLEGEDDAMDRAMQQALLANAADEYEKQIDEKHHELDETMAALDLDSRERTLHEAKRVITHQLPQLIETLQLTATGSEAGSRNEAILLKNAQVRGRNRHVLENYKQTLDDGKRSLAENKRTRDDLKQSLAEEKQALKEIQREVEHNKKLLQDSRALAERLKEPHKETCDRENAVTEQNRPLAFRTAVVATADTMTPAQAITRFGQLMPRFRLEDPYLHGHIVTAIHNAAVSDMNEEPEMRELQRLLPLLSLRENFGEVSDMLLEATLRARNQRNSDQRAGPVHPSRHGPEDLELPESIGQQRAAFSDFSSSSEQPSMPGERETGAQSPDPCAKRTQLVVPRVSEASSEAGQGPEAQATRARTTAVRATASTALQSTASRFATIQSSGPQSVCKQRLVDKEQVPAQDRPASGGAQPKTPLKQMRTFEKQTAKGKREDADLGRMQEIRHVDRRSYDSPASRPRRDSSDSASGDLPSPPRRFRLEDSEAIQVQSCASGIAAPPKSLRYPPPVRSDSLAQAAAKSAGQHRPATITQAPGRAQTEASSISPTGIISNTTLSALGPVRPTLQPLAPSVEGAATRNKSRVKSGPKSTKKGSIMQKAKSLFNLLRPAPSLQLIPGGGTGASAEVLARRRADGDRSRQEREHHVEREQAS